MTTIIEIELNDGRTISGSADFGKGSPANPMTDDELARQIPRMRGVGQAARASAEKIVDLVFGLEKVKSIREFTKLLHNAASARRRQGAATRRRQKMSDCD